MDGKDLPEKEKKILSADFFYSFLLLFFFPFLFQLCNVMLKLGNNLTYHLIIIILEKHIITITKRKEELKKDKMKKKI